MTRLVSIDRDDDYVVQLKTDRQNTHCKNNQLSDCATINPYVNSVINGKHALFIAGKNGCYMQSNVALSNKTSLKIAWTET